ncbi:hypothetical protein RFI_32146 [Reticulomyxa filosa]|uniref:Peptidase C14 caspase domain-containing protein n=1 Tax=Reticulomyxa filosa TaxID=46433 RepID=X6LWY7_RETFI|nr:hypothetical protein RFI_32146 [Reticulomyxa filosa]|eukprot:ETO05250.1 hypothetical protein RFI_32146 [Reticulomyxa filosa]
MSLKATVSIEPKKKNVELILSTLTMESLTATVQKLWFSIKRKNASDSESDSDSEDDQEPEFVITDKNNVRIEKDEDVERVYKSAPVHFNARLKPKKYVRKDQINAQQNHIIMNPLILLAGTIRHEKNDKKLNSVKHDMLKLKQLFKTRFKYKVMSTYNDDDCASELLTLDRLNQTLSNALQKVKTDAKYDGLIFIWCGYGNDKTGTLITSDGKYKHWNEIANVYEDTTLRFIAKPKVIIQNCIESKTSCEMKIDENLSWSRLAGSNTFFITTNLINDDPTGNTGSIFTKLFYEQLNGDHDHPISLNSIIENMNYTIKDKFMNENEQRLIKTCSRCSKDIYIGTHQHFLYGYIENTDPTWMEAIKKAEAMMEEMEKQKQSGIIVVASNLDEVLAHSDGCHWNLDEDVSIEMKEKQNPMKQKHFVGAFTIALFHCNGVKFEDVAIHGRVYAIRCSIACEDVYITNYVFLKMSNLIGENEDLVTITLPANFNQIYEAAVTSYDNDCYQLSIGYSLYAIFLMEQNPSIYPKPNDTTLTTLYGNLGFSYKEIDKYEKATYYFEKELNIYSTQSEVDNVYLSDCFHNLGYMYFKLEQYDKSIYYLEKSLSIWHASLDINNESVGHLYTILGLSYYFKNQFEKERECLEKCLEIYLKVLSNVSSSVALAYYNLGCVYQRQKLYDKALEFHEKALNIRINLLSGKYSDDSDDSDVPYCLNNIGNSENVDLSGSLDEDLGCSYHCIGFVLRKKGEFENAISYHEKGLKIIRKCLNLRDPDVELGDSYKSLGVAYEKIGNKSKAIENYENAVFTLHGKFGANHKKTLSAIAKLKEYKKFDIISSIFL